MSDTVRTRFAPSPTGFLHVGGARTALFAWAYARHYGGEFVLRIEDTDRERSTEESVKAIFDGMAWLGLDHDGEVVFQSHRSGRYRKVVDSLIDHGHAYHCDCSRERLDEIRDAQRQAGAKPRYDGRCRDLGLSAADNTVVRFRNPDSGNVIFDDAVKGRIDVANSELDDFVMVRSDGGPTYNLTVVVDDLDMEITHVIRGDDHVNNTPRQINLYHALGASIPVFAHLPMILGDDGERLSKRHGAVSVLQYQHDGYLPEAMLNYLVRLGWSHGDDEIFSQAEIVELFDLAAVNRAPSRFNTEKLNWINQQYLKSADPTRVAELLGDSLAALGVPEAHLRADLDRVSGLFLERAHTINEMAEQALFLYQDFEDYDPTAAKKQLRPVALDPLKALRAALSELVTWQADTIQSTIQLVADDLGVGFGKVGQPLRVAVSGRGAAPANDMVLELLGREKTLVRLDRAIGFAQARAEQ